ncbi:CBS domain-containing protein [Rhizobium sp. 1AS11]|uniref:CBS domain-containing protein n=1 Tax=Rhizobium acaciae TaxID=2989736 RepID=UPI00027D6BAE|nr:CBS domain-containing protein [Rhizobium acaciae]EJC64356.1 CBS domain-containing protein [Rhizobium leguminosarum bv. viciae WSM1455]MCW1408833.1 CBS domain-containing protein [Rhizobium acaciae]MCW1741212.1 CBS domain-containing protein [Rhizobium acaciae]MCW1749487.1 CBS domain-containing protein [Rhizobium acaciae]
MQVSEAMHKEVSWVLPTMSVHEVAKLMKEKDIGAVPVGENDRLIGMITDRDLAVRALADNRDVSKLTARDVMSPGINYCHTEDRIEEAVHKMEKHKIRRLPVMNDKQRMVGMLSIGDVSHCQRRSLSAELMMSVSGHHA